MSNTAVAEPVRSATVHGVTATSAMTPQEVFNAHLAAQGGQPIDFKAGARVGPPLNVHPSPLGGMATGERTSAAPNTIAGKAAPPSPQDLEASRRADLDAIAADVASRHGKPGDGQPVGASEVDQAGVAKLDAAYKDMMRNLEQMPPSQARDSNIEKIRNLYQTELKEFMEGRKAGEKRSEFRARRDGTAPAQGTGWSVPGENGSRALTKAGEKLQAELLAEYTTLPKAQQTAATARAYQVGLYNVIANERGTVNAGHFAAKDLSGYRLPPGEYPPQVIVDLARARAIGLTQAQVNRIIAAGL